MKDKAAKLGKFNVVDAAAAVLILLAVVFVAWRMVSGEPEAEERPVTMTITAMTEGVAAEIYEGILEHVEFPSQLMASGELLDGEIISMERQPYLVIGPDGEWYEDPNHVNLLFTVINRTTAGDVFMSKVGEQEPRIGRKDYTLKSEYIEFHNAIIVDVALDWNPEPTEG